MLIRWIIHILLWDTGERIGIRRRGKFGWELLVLALLVWLFGFGGFKIFS